MRLKTVWRHVILVAAVVVECGLFPAATHAADLVQLSDVVEVGGGGLHTCVRTHGGAAFCWGANFGGVLGYGGYEDSVNHAVGVSRLNRGVTALAAGSSFNCAVSGGGVSCWGSNDNGQLGNGMTIGRPTPTEVPGLEEDIVMVAAGNAHGCALTNVGGVKCWGLNSRGQLGDGTLNRRLTPVNVSGLDAGVTAIAARADHTCAILNGGALRCWGWNGSGQLGDGSQNNRTTPTAVAGLDSGVLKIVLGQEFSCALIAGGRVKCWGKYFGLGDGSATDRYLPGDVSGLTSGVRDIGAALYSACALTSDDKLKCWGFHFKGLGDGTRQERRTPTDVQGLEGRPVQVSGAGGHLCATLEDGRVQCWGDNTFSQLGNGVDAFSLVAIDADRIGTGARSIAGGGSHACYVTAQGAVRCYGEYGSGQLGYDPGPLGFSVEPVSVAAISDATAVQTGSNWSCALHQSGRVSCWGSNDVGQLGSGSTESGPTPSEVQGLPPNITAIEASRGYESESGHNCAIAADATLWCWGANSAGQLGDGTTSQRNQATQVPGLSGVEKVAVGVFHTCAALSAGGVKCWGRNNAGQLGNGTTSNRATPGDVSGLTGSITALSAGANHTCAVAAGVLKCWGANRAGQLGDGTHAFTSPPSSTRTTPVTVAGGLNGVQAIAAGNEHTCALLADGSVRCWGINHSGQIGDGTRGFSFPEPSRIPTIASGAVAISAGSAHTCARMSSGTVRCWGTDDWGQLGRGQVGLSLSPVFVMTNPPLIGATALTAGADQASSKAVSDASGRYIVFQSQASNLVANDTNGSTDVFRLDTYTGRIKRVSVDDLGRQMNGDSTEPTISADGKMIAFVAPDIAVRKVYGESKAAAEKRMKGNTHGVFLRNMLTGSTQRVGQGMATGVETNPQIAADASTVVFTNETSENLGTPGTPNVHATALVPEGQERVARTVRCLSCKTVSPMGIDTATDSDGASRNAVVSGDGRYVAFETAASNLLEGQPSPCANTSTSIVLRDLLTGASQRVSPPSTLPASNCGTQGSSSPCIDYSGNVIAFVTDQALTPADVSGQLDVYVADRSRGQTQRISETTSGADANGASMDLHLSGDGQTIAFVTAATNLDTDADNNGQPDLHVSRIGSRRVDRLADAAPGVQVDAAAGNPSLGYNGIEVVFDSDASNLSAASANRLRNVYLREVPENIELIFRTGME